MKAVAWGHSPNHCEWIHFEFPYLLIDFANMKNNHLNNSNANVNVTTQDSNKNNNEKDNNNNSDNKNKNGNDWYNPNN